MLKKRIIYRCMMFLSVLALMAFLYTPAVIYASELETTESVSTEELTEAVTEEADGETGGNGFVNIFVNAWTWLYNLLPQSPFQAIYDSLDIDTTVLSYINWFIPLDNFLTITYAWVACILAYYIFIAIKKFICDVVLDKLGDIIGDLL